MTWTCMAANERGSLVFINEVTADRGNKGNSEIYSSILSVRIQPNAQLNSPDLT